MDDLAEVTSCRQPHRGRRRSRCIGQRQYHDETFLRGHQNVSIAEPIQDDSLESACGGCDRGKPLPGFREGNLMRTGQVESERLCPLHELAQVRVATQRASTAATPTATSSR
jgi:hypothetical protein